jgi:glycosyltransferase involved in cell wall biosynthesis
MGTYPPRECGIATFNQDLLHSSQKYLGEMFACKVAALNLSSLDTYTYPKEVAWKIDQNNPGEMTSLSDLFNHDPSICGVMIQHEYGIYGNSDGKNLLAFMKRCNKPMVVTLHTVLPQPTAHMLKITQEIIREARIVVVLTKSSKKILESIYPEVIGKLHVIPHGIHGTNFSNTKSAKRNINLDHKIILSTFGLLSRGKGIEYVIRALPSVIKKHPSIKYLILGETHPVVRREEGESYRHELAAEIAALNLKGHVTFYDQYLSLTDLMKFLKATDIYISSSINPDQAVSGTLSYALGTGRAVISTDFAQAKEIITKETGVLVPTKDVVSLSQALMKMLSNPTQLTVMHANAYKKTRPMVWSNVAKRYSKLLTQFMLPPVNLSHLKKMTDEFGLFQFATLTVPNKKYGYTLDDNARALVVASWLNHPSLLIYLHFIQKCQLKNGMLRNYINHEKKEFTDQNKTEDLEDATARAMWALSEVIANKSIHQDLRSLATSIFDLTLPHTQTFQHIRSMAFMIKAFANLDKSHIKISIYRKEIRRFASNLLDALSEHSHKSWVWFDSYLGYNNAVVPEALMIAGSITSDTVFTKKGLQTLSFLIKKTFSDNHYLPIGHSSWYENNEKRSSFDQQPEDPASMILALDTAHTITRDESYRNLMSVCFSWFLGNNSLKLPLYNHHDGGCFDGLHPDRVNLNQGAESQVSYLLSRLTMDKVSN